MGQKIVVYQSSVFSAKCNSMKALEVELVCWPAMSNAIIIPTRQCIDRLPVEDIPYEIPSTTTKYANVNYSIPVLTIVSAHFSVYSLSKSLYFLSKVPPTPITNPK